MGASIDDGAQHTGSASLEHLADNKVAYHCNSIRVNAMVAKRGKRGAGFGTLTRNERGRVAKKATRPRLIKRKQ